MGPKHIKNRNTLHMFNLHTVHGCPYLFSDVPPMRSPVYIICSSDFLEQPLRISTPYVITCQTRMHAVFNNFHGRSSIQMHSYKLKSVMPLSWWRLTIYTRSLKRDAQSHGAKQTYLMNPDVRQTPGVCLTGEASAARQTGTIPLFLRLVY